MARQPYRMRPPRGASTIEPGEQFPPSGAHDSFILTPNQRIAFSAAYLAIFALWLIAAAAAALTDSFVPGAFTAGVCAIVLSGLVSVTKGLLRKYVLEEAEWADPRPR